MAAGSLSLQNLFGRLNVIQIASPVLILMVLSMMVLPLPAWVLTTRCVGTGI